VGEPSGAPPSQPASCSPTGWPGCGGVPPAATRRVRHRRYRGRETPVETRDDICTLRAMYRPAVIGRVDLLTDLESGALAAPAPTAPEEVPSTAEVARRWAVALGLRPGNTQGPTPSALLPVVEAWARGHGWTGPDVLQLGAGLNAAGLRRRRQVKSGALRLLLHPADCAKLWRLVRAAWAPARAPGDRRGVKRPKSPRLKRTLTPRPAPPQPFREAVRGLHHSARPLLDSLGRVWPCPSVAARALRGNPKALGNSLAWLRAALEGPPVDSRPLLEALKRKGHWRGVWWRYLTPEEVAAVPEGHMVGAPLRPYRWGLVCECGGHGSGP
jgi:hypothetical protein